MIKIENVEVVGWEHAVRGMRNPMNSWKKSDSQWVFGCPSGFEVDEPVHSLSSGGLDCQYFIGKADKDLMMRLRNAGTDHRKFMRMIAVYLDITAPLYWWKEYDTYKVGTVANSCSTMHRIHAKEFTLDDFSHEHLSGLYLKNLETTVSLLNDARKAYTESKSKDDWWNMIQLLPSSYNQRRTVMLNYEVLANMYKSRKGHKLDEWRDFCKWAETLPLSELITGERHE